MSGSLTNYRPTRAEALCAFIAVEKYLWHTASVFCYSAGSFRYAIDQERIGDVDIIVSYLPEQKASLDHALASIFGRHDNGSPKTQGLIGQIQVDLFPIQKEYVGAVETFYGNPLPLQMALRAIAAARGFKLTPQGLKDRNTAELIPTHTVKDVFDLLGVEQFTPIQTANAAHYKMENTEVFSNV